MLYYLFKFLREQFDLSGAGLFQYISFRATLAAILSLFISIVFGKKLIRLLQRKQIGENIRTLGLQGENLKAGTPTMGGVIIIAAVVIPTLLFAKPDNIYVILLLVTTLWMGTIGFIDDYIKTFKKNKQGLRGKFKIIGQVGLGLIVGTTMFYHQDIMVREFDEPTTTQEIVMHEVGYHDTKNLKTTIPFFKENELDYRDLFPGNSKTADLIFYLIVVTFIITAVSNGANMTDGLDGLAAGTSAIIAITLAAFAYVSGNMIFSNYLNIMYLPNTGEVVVFCIAFVAACIGFLWYNSYPAQVFMGDTGSLALGAVISALAIMLRKELLIPLLCGIFFIENMSVLLQVSYFKYTKKRFGEGRRIFKMAPLHHHYQKVGLHESKIVSRFWITGIILAILTLVTLKIR